MNQKHHARALVENELVFFIISIDHLRKVVARGKVLPTGPEYNYPKRAVRGEFVQCGDDLADHILGERVESLGRVQRYQADLTAGVQENLFVFHVVSSAQKDLLTRNACYPTLRKNAALSRGPGGN